MLGVETLVLFDEWVVQGVIQVYFGFVDLLL